jgi:hypothetical protein
MRKPTIRIHEGNSETLPTQTSVGFLNLSSYYRLYFRCRKIHLYRVILRYQFYFGVFVRTPTIGTGGSFPEGKAVSV